MVEEDKEKLEEIAKEKEGNEENLESGEEAIKNTENQEEETAEDKEEDYLPKKRVIRRKKSKKDKEHPLAGAIRLAVETGKVEFGSRKGLKDLVLGKAKLFVISDNLPAATKEEITRYSATSSVPIIEFDGNNMELGSICGKPFSVSVLSVYETGNSNILDLAAKEKKK